MNRSSAFPQLVFQLIFLIILISLIMTATGCSADDPMNESFPLRMSDARTLLEEMENDPRPLIRPVIIAGGIHDPGVAAPGFAKRLRKLVGDDAPVVHVSFFDTWSMDACRRKLIRTIQERFPGDNPASTVEVDVVAISMGGVVSRFAALDDGADVPRLRIARLFTISSPHRGARLATLPTIDSRALDMRHDSEFIASINAGTPPYPIIPYGRLGDCIVGADNMAPPGETCWWVACPFMSPSHLAAARDPRFLVDIALRLRGDEPFTVEPRSPLP